MHFFSRLATSTSFPVCYNLLPHFTGEEREHHLLLDFVAKALADGRINTFFLSDRAGRHPDFTARSLAEEIIGAGGEPVLSLTPGSRTGKGVVDRLRQYYRTGVNHFLFVSGDYVPGSAGSPEHPGHALDSVQMLLLAAEFEDGANIAKGCVVSPFKTFESEQIWQYEKLQRKIGLGADFIVSQAGYDIRKYDELLRFCSLHAIAAPLVANVFLTCNHTARLIQARKIPGVKIPGPLLRILHEETAGHESSVDRAAKMLAVVKGLGYNGALLGGINPDFSEIRQILDKAEKFAPEWQDYLAELDYSAGAAAKFYYFNKDPRTGLNTSESTPIALKHFPSPTYSFSYFIDWLVYVPDGPLFGLTGGLCRFCSTSKFGYAALWLLEYISKGPLYGCRMCGDCTLYACGFLCYQAGCPKKIVNGPCGGSIDGYCEAFPEKKRCFWVRVYHHMKGVRQHVSFTAPPIPVRDGSLDRTSSWINFFLGRDHRKMQSGDR